MADVPVLALAADDAPVDDGASMLWYRTPAEDFIEALPVGNGLMGAMTHGRVGGDLLHLNEGSAWSGGPGSADLPTLDPDTGAALLQRIRDLIDAGRATEAEDALRAFQARHSQAYQPFADLVITASGCAPAAPVAAPAAAPPNAAPASATPAPTDAAAARTTATATAPADGPQRWLDLRDAVAGHRYLLDGAEVRHHTFASHPDRVLVHTIAAPSRPGFGIGIAPRLRPAGVLTWSVAGAVASGYLELVLPTDVSPDHEVSTGNIRYSDTSRHGGLALTVVADPDARFTTDPADPARLLVTGSTQLLVFAATGTTLSGGLPHADTAPDRDALRDLLTTRVDAARSTGIGELHRRHVADHQRLWTRSRLSFATTEAGRPTDERLALSARRGGDLGLLPLLYGYGRYLLIASSRPGGFPANLQGIWNIEPVPPWSSNYTININTQMNYWPALPTGLAECAEPLLGLIEVLADTGRDAAAIYGLPGWVAHHNTDPWGQAAAVGAGIGDACWSSWPMGGVWLCRHVADQVRHTGDAALAWRFWPVVEQACRFASAWITVDASGTPRTSPATSPENHYRTADGEVVAVATSTTMDVVLLRDLARTALLLRGYADAAGDVAAEGSPTESSPTGHSADWLPTFCELVAALPDPGVGPDGEVREWADIVEEFEPTHRHVSHLAGIYPIGSWTQSSTPELWEAAKRTLDRRGPGSTGWSLAWHLCLSGRLGDAERAAESLRRAVRPPANEGPHSGGLCPNLFSTHPPFQIDGSFGLVAGIVELLVHWEDDAVTLLPSLPADWPDGEVTGLHGPGGWSVDLRWQARTLLEARLTAGFDAADHALEVRWPDGRRSVQLSPGVASILTTTTASGSEG